MSPIAPRKATCPKSYAAQSLSGILNHTLTGERGKASFLTPAMPRLIPAKSTSFDILFFARLLCEAGKNVADRRSAWPKQSMSVEIRSGHGRLRSGSATAVASRDGLAAREPRAKDGPFACKLRIMRYRKRWCCAGTKSAGTIRLAKYYAGQTGLKTAIDRCSCRRKARKAGRSRNGGRFVSSAIRACTVHPRQ